MIPPQLDYLSQSQIIVMHSHNKDSGYLIKKTSTLKRLSRDMSYCHHICNIIIVCLFVAILNDSTKSNTKQKKTYKKVEDLEDQVSL